ncbi:Mn2+ and Fe2+ transporter-like protein [Halobiforma nitratireducens JCM 10879]|uniref:Mn2+ and Fe2+ transporter-like protein n=1 Tax=Halobiforma nitratireducens JCM 10879 TaxID=1227454 RepID=M0MN54_9EURY|nr:hypothetical protein [Halobiforma nitratireducens]EMA47076.1 Mn2+ and Fe2+ transporter-like protein [Halobiforma nitratireducens JCM 10879]
MSTIRATVDDTVLDFAHRYGLAFVMVASYFGSGSVFIVSQAGVLHGYTLLWAAAGAALLGFMAQDMSARLGIHGTPLMVFVRRKLGQPIAVGLAAAVGAGVSFMTGGVVGWQPIAVLATLGAIAVGLLNYDNVENLMITLLVVDTQSNVKQGSDMVQFYLRELVQDVEENLVDAVEDELGASVSKTNVREPAYVVAMRQPEIVAEELERWGFEDE